MVTLTGVTIPLTIRTTLLSSVQVRINSRPIRCHHSNLVSHCYRLALWEVLLLQLTVSHPSISRSLSNNSSRQILTLIIFNLSTTIHTRLPTVLSLNSSTMHLLSTFRDRSLPPRTSNTLQFLRLLRTILPSFLRRPTLNNLRLEDSPSRPEKVLVEVTRQNRHHHHHRLRKRGVQ